MDKFWSWYERHYTLNLTITTGLFLLQLVHLYWLTVHVVAHRLLGFGLWDPSNLLQTLIIIVDYTEIPVLIGTSLVYLHELRKSYNGKSLLYLVLLNSQWLHLFWITDEFVVEVFGGVSGTILPVWFAWVAIGIDYLELPVIYDTIKKSLKALKFSR